MRVQESSPESLFKQGLKELALAHTDEQVRAFMTYLSELKKWNRAYNLTSLAADEEIVIKHFLDSLLYLRAIPEGEVSVLDVGSGAGFPGIPLKIMRPEIKVFLAEPSRKKVSFLRHIIGVLKLEGIEVIEKRIEEVRSPSVDIAVTRALFSIKDLLRKASPVVRAGGRLIVSKGPRVTEELKAVRNTDYDLLPLTLPLSTAKRFLVVIKKAAQQSGASATSCPPAGNALRAGHSTVCRNSECRLRKAGCRGFEGCPGFR